MQALRLSLMNESTAPRCCPSDLEEVKKFMHLPDEYMEQLQSYKNAEGYDIDTYEYLDLYIKN